MADVTVLALLSAGTAATTGGSITAAVDVAGRVRRYRAALGDARSQPGPFHIRMAQEAAAMSLGVPSSRRTVTAAELDFERASRERAEARLAAAAGATASLRRLWISAGVALGGVLLSAAADIVASIRT